MLLKLEHALITADLLRPDKESHVAVEKNGLRTTVPLVFYIRNSLRFWYYASLSTCCQNLGKKIGVTRKIWEKVGVKLSRDLTEKSVNFSTLATSNIRLLLVFGEEDQQMKLVRLVRKNIMITEEKLRK